MPSSPTVKAIDEVLKIASSGEATFAMALRPEYPLCALKAFASIKSLISAMILGAIARPSPSLDATLHRRNFRYKLPDGYTIERAPGVGELDSRQVYGAIIVAMLGLAYEESRNLTDPVFHSYPAMTLNITGVEEDSQYYRQFASYTLYHALETLTSSGDFTASNFTLQNKAGSVACRVVLGPRSADWQRLIGGSSIGLSPRSPSHNSLPSLLKTRQSRSFNESQRLESLTPFYISDWYGPESNETEFFMALATLIVKISDISDKDSTINFQRVENLGYHLNVTNVPLQSQVDYLTNRGVLNLCAYAYRELTSRLGYGIDPVTNLEATLIWTNGTELIQQHAFRYEGAVKKASSRQ
ncbi:MAG: hypothetical protein LQ350_004954 [Teloschistes chrysophthalmus]|nr:MAG: hypothetical protein LQ350_004954 [Niorma chrysophthalma]